MTVIPDEKIDDRLAKAAKQALIGINKKDCSGIAAYKAKEIINIGLAIYGGNAKVKAIFGPGRKGIDKEAISLLA